MYTAPQVAFLNDLKLNSLVKKLKQKQHMLDLQKQIMDKRLREESQRLFLNQKEMATSASIMHALNPGLFKVSQGSA